MALLIERGLELSGYSEPGLPASAVHGERKGFAWMVLRVAVAGIFWLALCPGAHAQDPLNDVHVQPAPPPPVAPITAPDDAAGKKNTPAAKSTPAPSEGPKALLARPNERIRVDVNLVLVPVTVTDPLNRLVTGLEKQDFFLYENNALQKIKSFSAEDAPVSIGIIFDLSGSMTDKINRARNSILEFMHTGQSPG